MLKHRNDRYASASILLHWLMLVVIIAVYVFINLHDSFPKGSETRELMKHWHFMAGLTVLLLVIIRLALLLQAGHRPAIKPRPAPWVAFSSRLMHWTLYAFMLGMPILGWLVLSAGGKTIPFDLPALLDLNKPLARNLKNVHETIGVIGYYLLGLHAAAALFHHYFLKDNTLKRMLPSRSRK